MASHHPEVPADEHVVDRAGGRVRSPLRPRRPQAVRGDRALAGRSTSRWPGPRAVSDGVVLVVGADHVDDPEPMADVVVVGGERRSDSVRRGLDAVPDDCDIVVVHDGARPLASSELFESVIEAVLAGADAAIPGVAGDRHHQADRRRLRGRHARSRRPGGGADPAGVPGRRAAPGPRGRPRRHRRRRAGRVRGRHGDGGRGRSDATSRSPPATTSAWPACTSADVGPVDRSAAGRLALPGACPGTEWAAH